MHNFLKNCPEVDDERTFDLIEQITFTLSGVYFARLRVGKIVQAALGTNAIGSERGSDKSETADLLLIRWTVSVGGSFAINMEAF